MKPLTYLHMYLLNAYIDNFYLYYIKCINTYQHTIPKPDSGQNLFSHPFITHLSRHCFPYLVKSNILTWFLRSRFLDNTDENLLDNTCSTLYSAKYIFPIPLCLYLDHNSTLYQCVICLSQSPIDNLKIDHIKCISCDSLVQYKVGDIYMHKIFKLTF